MNGRLPNSDPEYEHEYGTKSESEYDHEYGTEYESEYDHERDVNIGDDESFTGYNSYAESEFEFEHSPGIDFINAVRQGNLYRIQRILEIIETDIVKPDDYEYALKIAITNGDIDIVRLLKFDVAPNIFTDNEIIISDIEAYIFAIKNGRNDIAEFIASNSTELEICEAIRTGNTQLIFDSIQADPRVVNTRPYTAAFIAAGQINQIDVLKEILAQNPNILSIDIVAKHFKDFSDNSICEILNCVPNEIAISNHDSIGNLLLKVINANDHNRLSNLLKIKPALINNHTLINQFCNAIDTNNISQIRTICNAIKEAQIDISKIEIYKRIFNNLTERWNTEVMVNMLNSIDTNSDVVKLINEYSHVRDLNELEKLIINAVQSHKKTAFTNIMFTFLLNNFVKRNYTELIDALLNDSRNAFYDSIYLKSMKTVKNPSTLMISEQPKLPYLPQSIKKHCGDYISVLDLKPENFYEAYKNMPRQNNLFKHVMKYMLKTHRNLSFTGTSNEVAYRKFLDICNEMLSDKRRIIPENQILDSLKTASLGLPNDIIEHITLYARQHNYLNALEFSKSISNQSTKSVKRTMVKI